VNGRLSALDGSALQGKTVILSYAVANSPWVPIGSAVTNENGGYNIQWVNVASGTFTLKVQWTEDTGYQATTNTTSISFLPYDIQNLFHVESNSTVTVLAFNSTSAELSFKVEGPNGTSGYVKATIAKTLMANATDTKVYLDGNKLDYKVSSTTNSWILTFNYHHSAHQVTIALVANVSTEPAIILLPNWAWATIVLVVVVPIAGFIAWRNMKKH
jgi:hypothetical protein